MTLPVRSSRCINVLHDGGSLCCSATRNSSSLLLTCGYCVQNPPVVAVNPDTAHTITPCFVEINLNIRPRFLKWCLVVVIVVFLGFRDKPRMYYSLAGLLYRPIWTFQVGPPDASAPVDVSRTPCLHSCRHVPHSSSGSWNYMGGEIKPNFA
jgi:hypothetical protein